MAAPPLQPSPPVQAAPPRVSDPAPANINVSVRIGSPGDNGAVSQLNVTLSTPVAQPAESPGARVSQPVTSTPSDGQGTAGGGGPSASAPAAAATPETAANPLGAPAASADPDAWYWSWDCLGSPPLSAISLGASGTNSLPSSWTWIWNCGANSSQYQGGTSGGYQPINTNISIRIASPGDDGAVTQVNQLIATQVSQARAQIDQVVGQTVSAVIAAAPPTGIVPPLVETSIPTPVISLPPLGHVLGGAFAVLVPGTSGGVAGITSSTPEIAPGPTVSTSAAPGWAATVALPLSGTAPGGPAAARLSIAGGHRLPRQGIVRADAAFLRDPAPGWVTESSRPAVPPQAAPVLHVAGAASRDAGRHRPAPGPAPGAPTTIPSVSAAAVGGGGSPGPGLPFLLMLPIVAALLDLARRVALQRGTWPSGHRRRAPERPG